MSKMEDLHKELDMISISKSKMDDLPKELVISILLHLAAEDLLRCKCVCKSLYSLITSPSFIEIRRKVRNSYILVQYRDCISKNQVISLLCDETIEVLDTQQVLFDTPLMDMSKQHFTLVGCCNGVLCLRFIRHDRYVLWNPATRDAKIIPDGLYKSNPDKKMFRHETMGFGFDSETNDCKLVSIQLLFGNALYPVRPHLREVEVYSLKTGCWKLLPGITPTCDKITQPLGKGCGEMFSWFVWNEDYGQHKHGIISFDMSNEVFIETPLPPCIINGRSRNRLIFHNTSLAIENRVRDRKNDTETSNIWVLGEYGVKESWTNLFTVGPFEHIQQIIKGLWNKNKVLLQEHGCVSNITDLILIDHSFRKVKDVVTRAATPSIEVFNYQESLVQINATPPINLF